MNKLSKIFLIIIIVLTIVLGVMIYKYLNLRNDAKHSLDTMIENAEELQKAYKKIDELEDKIDTINGNNAIDE